MKIRPRILSVGLGMLVLCSTPAASLVAQEPDSPSKPAADSTPARKESEPSRRVPPYFGQIGLTPEQREKIYEVLGRHQEKIDEMERQIAEAKVQAMRECEALLTDSQRELLEQRRRSASREPIAPKKPSSSSEKSKSESSSR